MLAFRVLLVSIIVVVLAYTGVVGARHGWNFAPPFFTALLAFDWQGQFNLDFAALLLLAALWLAWRHRFSAGGLAGGLLVLVGGSPLLCAYLLVIGLRGGADARVLLLGPSRAGG